MQKTKAKGAEKGIPGVLNSFTGQLGNGGRGKPENLEKIKKGSQIKKTTMRRNRGSGEGKKWPSRL